MEDHDGGGEAGVDTGERVEQHRQTGPDHPRPYDPLRSRRVQVEQERRGRPVDQCGTTDRPADPQIKHALTAVVQQPVRPLEVLEDAGIKLSSVVSSIMSLSGGDMLNTLADGERDPAVLAEMSRRALRGKIPELIDALEGRFTDHHAFMVRMHLGLIDQHTAAIDDPAKGIEVVIGPFRTFRELICTIPAVEPQTADVIAETGADMSRFASAAHLASWAGTAPGMNEFAGKVKSCHVRPGNPYLKDALGTAAMNLARMPAAPTSASDTGA